jgi:hypothetical protein
VIIAAVKVAEIRARRAVAQRLHRPRRAGPEAIVSALLAVQAQDVRAAPLALRARATGLTAAAVDAALGALGNGALGGQSALLVGAAAAAVAIEFGLLRAPQRDAPGVRAHAHQEAAI